MYFLEALLGEDTFRANDCAKRRRMKFKIAMKRSQIMLIRRADYRTLVRLR